MTLKLDYFKELDAGISFAYVGWPQKSIFLFDRDVRTKPYFPYLITFMLLVDSWMMGHSWNQTPVNGEGLLYLEKKLKTTYSVNLMNLQYYI